ncbi:MAG: hypothetical protein ACFFDN_32860 [Candidatus Hodarchaeota archaeon]
MSEVVEDGTIGSEFCWSLIYFVLYLGSTGPIFITFNDPFFGTIFKILYSSYLFIGLFCFIFNKKVRIIGSFIGIIFCVIIIICLFYGYDWYLNHFKIYNVIFLVGAMTPSLSSLPFIENLVIIIDKLMIEINFGFRALIFGFAFTIGGIINIIGLNVYIEHKLSKEYAKSDRITNTLIKLADSNKDSDELSLDNKIFPRVHLGEEFLTPSKPIICMSCGMTNPKESRICKFCHVRLPICAICERTISMEDLVYCLYCDATHHKLEFLEWLKIKAHCINCNRELDLWEFQKFLKEHGDIEEISSKLCIKCKKLIPIDSQFCIFCGIKLKYH